MSTDEEYLDNLLKTMSTDDSEENDDNKIMSLMNETDPMKGRTAPMRKEVFSDIRPENENKPAEDESWKAELDEMLAKADKAETETPIEEAPKSETESTEKNKDSAEESGLEMETVPEKPERRKKEKKRRHFLFKKKKKEENAEEKETTDASIEGVDSPEWTSISGDGNDDQAEQDNVQTFEEPDWADEIREKDTEKKKGFFEKVLDTLFQEEPDIEGEAGEKKKSGKKEKKKKEKANAGNPEAESGEAPDGKEDRGKKAEKKKAKQQKKEEKKRKKELEPKQPKVLNRKSLSTLIAFDATVIAAVLLLGIFLPDYIDRREARDAFYNGDYMTVYQNLHGKDLGESDTVLLNRAAAVEKLQRKLDSYQINMRIENQAQALDALLSGVAVYNDIMAAGNTYGAESELSTLYQQIIDTLQSQFQLDEVTAREVNSYESDDDYSEAVYSLIHDGKLPASEETEGTEETENGADKLPDLLPEEEGLMEVNTDSSF